MSALQKLIVVEGRLFLREPLSVIFGILFPAALLLGLGVAPALREPSEEFGGQRFVEFFAPSALVISLAILGLQHIPGVVATYRENGILRRMSTTPVHPAKVLVAQLVIVLAAAVAGAVVLILAAWLVLDVPIPQHLPGFAAAFLLGIGALMALGLVIAAIAPNTRSANGLAVLVFMLVMFFGGVYVPRFVLPEALVRIGDYTPPGVQALLDAWAGQAPQITQLGIMALVAVAAGWGAAKLFRWE